MRKKNQEFMKPMEAANVRTTMSVTDPLPFDIVYRPERTPAVPSSKFTIASA
jgi:hypothetical protein